MDADVEPEPCRDCMTPIPPDWGWCSTCYAARNVRMLITAAQAVADARESHDDRRAFVVAADAMDALLDALDAVGSESTVRPGTAF